MKQKAPFAAALRSVLPLRAMAIRVRAGLGQPQNPSFFSYKTISE